MFTKQQIEALSAKLDGSAVKQRSQAGRSLSYIEGWHAIAEANRIFGFDMWHRETVEMRQLGEPRECKIGKAPYEKDGWRVAYMAKVRIEVFAGERCIIREGCGYGSGIDADLGAAHESALKEAETDAMKRALMTFGNPFGLALYDKDREHVGVDFDATAAAARIKASIAKQSTPADLDDLYRRERGVIEEIKAVSADLNGQLMAAFKARKSELQPKEQAA